MRDLAVSKAELTSWMSGRQGEGVMIEYHPLGFLRLPLTDTDRLKDGYYLHVWHSEVPSSIDRAAEIHNHIFALRSRILVGKLINLEYAITENPRGDHELLTAVYSGKTSARVPSGRLATCNLIRETAYKLDDVYEVTPGTFHKTNIAEYPSATLMEKSGVQRSQSPLNVRQLDAEPSFQRDFDHGRYDQSLAWAIMFETVQLMRK